MTEAWGLARIDDVGIGVFFDLYECRFEVLARIQHVEHLEGRFGVGPHTISVPRLEPATGSEATRRKGEGCRDVYC